MSNLVRVDFHGDTLDCVKDDDSISVSIRRVCEGLGIATQRQLEKLKDKAWATVTMKVMVADDGKNREVACIALDSLPMWLATIEPSRVRPALRSKLELYQIECAQVLRNHFLGQPSNRIDALESKMSQVLDLITQVIQRPVIAATPSEELGRAEASEVLRKIRQIAHNMSIGTSNPRKEFASWRTKIDRELRRQFNHDGFGASWNTLPRYRRPELMRILNAKIAESEKVARGRWAAPQLQLIAG